MRSDTLLRSQLAAMIADWVAAELTGAKIALFTNDITPSPTTVWGDLVEVDATIQTWYARATLVAGEPYDTEDGDHSFNLTWPSKQFNYTGAVPSITVRGYAIITVVAGPPEVVTVLSIGLLPAPVLMADVLNSVVAQPQLHFPSIPFAAE